MGLFTEFEKYILYVEMQRAMTILKNRRLALPDNHDVVKKWNSICINMNAFQKMLTLS